MGILSRVTQLIFGSQAGAQQIGQIGSKSAGIPAYTTDLAAIQSLNAFLQGLYAITQQGVNPPYIQDLNALYFLITSQLAYIFQAGVPEYDPETPYFNLISFVQVSGVLYQSISGTSAAPNVGNPPASSPAAWRNVDPYTIAQALASEITRAQGAEAGLSSALGSLGTTVTAQGSAQTALTATLNALIAAVQTALVITSGTSSTLAANSAAVVLVKVSAAYTLTLPQASTCVGWVVDIVQAFAGQALLTVTPAAGDSIGQLAAGVSCFLQNVDGGGSPYYFQHLKLAATASGHWAVIDGQFCPAQSVDANGSHYHLGKLHHLPLGGTTSRALTNPAVPGLNSWSTAVQAAGVAGVPAGAKAVRIKLSVGMSTSTGLNTLELAFSDNNTAVPALGTAHPMLAQNVYYSSSVTVGPLLAGEIDVPLNAAGQFYIYNLSASLSSFNALTVVGYWMGD